MTNNNYNAQTDEQIARDILSILPDTPEDPNKEPTESPKVFMLPIRQLKSFQNHPFKIVDNDEMKDLMHSIRDYGIMTPITVYVNKNAEYEIVSGHRRVFACKMLKMTEIPAIIMDYDRDQAVLAMVDSNLHREKLLPSEKGFAYKMKLEALKNQHREMEFEMQMRSDEILAKEVGESRATIQRLIRITKLISPFRDLLDYECMTFGVAYIFAGCDPVGQDMLYCFFWGIAAVIWLKYIYPVISKWIERIPMKVGTVMVWGLSIFMAVNMVVTCAAMTRYTQRANGIEPAHSVAQWLDETFPDAWMENRYQNMQFT